MSSDVPEMFDVLRRVREKFPMLPMAFGHGGRHANLVGPLGGGLQLGALVVIDQGGEPAIVGQVEGLELSSRQLGDFAATVESDHDGGTTHAGHASPVLRFVSGQLALLGTITGTTFDTAVPLGGFPEALYRPATDQETERVLQALHGDRPLVPVGKVEGTADVPANLLATGFSRHTFLCGQSGSGKTYATGVLLERLRLATELPMVILDPNSDHVFLGDTRPEAQPADTAERYASRRDEVRVIRGRGWGGDATLAVHFSDVPAKEQSLLLDLDPVADLHEYAAFRAAVDALQAPYSVDDVADSARGLGTDAGADLATRIANLGIGSWGIWCRGDEASFVDGTPLAYRCVVLDLGSLALPAERTLVAASILSWLWGRRANKVAKLLVVDEAHNVFPAHPTNALEASAAEIGIAIAAEGRKYGIHLLMATQRPSKVHPMVVSQCDNLVLLRVNATTDVEDLCRTFSHVPPGLIRQAPELTLGEIVFAGPISPTPLRTRIGARLSLEGGGDLPTDWAHPTEDR